MKKVWRIRKDSKAVSPVIATILMVAITVVLAAVLYVMVMGFGGGETQTPIGSFTAVEKVGSGQYKVIFGAITPTTNFDECKISVNGTADDVNLQTVIDSSGSLTVGGVTIYYNVTDLGGDGKISVGDYITFSNLATASGVEYTVNLIFIETGGSIAEKVITTT